MMSTNMVIQDLQSIIPVPVPQTSPPHPLVQPYTSVPILQETTAQDTNKPILHTLLSSRECLGKSSAPQTVQPVPIKEMLPAFPLAASSPISVPTSSVSTANKKYAVVVATVGGVVTKTFLMPLASLPPSNQAPKNPCTIVMPTKDGPSQTPSAPGRRIIIPSRKNCQNVTTILSPQTIQSTTPAFSYNPANIIVKTAACPAARSVPSIVHNKYNQNVVTVMPPLPTSHLSETNVSMTPVNDLMSISPIVIAPTTPQKSPSPIVIAPTTPQKSAPPIIIAPTTPQKSRIPIVITPVVSQKSPESKQKKCCNEYAASNLAPFHLAQSLARHVIHGNDESQIVEDAEKGITDMHTVIQRSELEQNNGSSEQEPNNSGNELGLVIDSVYSEQNQNNSGSELALRIDSVYSEQDQQDGGNELGLVIDSVYSEQDQYDGSSELPLRIDSVYSEQDQNDGVDELGFRIDNVYSEQEQNDGANALGIRIDNVFSLAEEESSAFHDMAPSHNIGLDDRSIDTDSDSSDTEPFSDSEMLQTNTHTENASAQTDLTNCQDFLQSPRKYHFEDEIKQILTEKNEERKLGCKDHVTTRLDYLPMNTDATCEELLQPETRLDITSEEILDSELERIIPEMVIPDAVTCVPSVKDGLSCLTYGGKGYGQRHHTTLDKRCVARKRCTQVSKYFQQRNHSSKPIRRCSVLTPKLVVEEDGSYYDVENVQCSCGKRLSDIKKEHVKRQKLVNSINHDHTYSYSGDGVSDMHNTSDISTDSASSAGYHWSSEDEDGGIHVRGEAVLEVISVTNEIVLADSTLKNILWAPVCKKRKKKLKPRPNPLIGKQKSHVQYERLIHTKDGKTNKTLFTCPVKAEGKALTDKVEVGGVEWKVEPKRPLVDPEDQDKSLGWILSKDERGSLDDTSLATGFSLVQTCSNVPTRGKQNPAETTLSTEGSHNASSSNIQQGTQAKVPKTLFKLVLKRENNSDWMITVRDGNHEQVRKDHQCDSLTEPNANKESEACKETSVKHISSEKPQSEQNCSTAVKDNKDEEMNVDMPKLSGKLKRGRPRKHPKGNISDKSKLKLENGQHQSCSSHSDGQNSIFGEHQASTESEVDQKVQDNEQQNTGKEVTSTNNCSTGGMVSMSTEKPLNGREESVMEGSQSCTCESDEKDGSDAHFSSTLEDNGATLLQSLGKTLNENEKISPKITSSDATNLNIPEIRKRGRPRKYTQMQKVNRCKRLTKRKCKRLAGNDKNNSIPISEDLPSDPPLTLDLSPECNIRVIDLPVDVMGKLGLTNNPPSVNQSLVDSLNEILPLINSEKNQVDVASDADAFPDLEDANRGLSPVIVDPASQEKHSKESPSTDNSCSAAGSVRSIEPKDLSHQPNGSAITQGTSTQDNVKQGNSTKGLSRIEQLKAKLKQQEEALQLVRQRREQSKKAFEAIDMV